MNESEKLLFDLLRIALGHGSQLDYVPDRDVWSEVFPIARKQAVVGVVVVALDLLDNSNKAPLSVYSRFALATEKIHKLNSRCTKRCGEVTAIFESAGFRTTILKGQGIAELYADPDSRSCGDIDIWVDAPREEILAFLRPRYKLGKVVYHHIDADIFPDVPVEVHTNPSWMNGARANRKLQEFFAANAGDQFVNRSENGYCRPRMPFNAVYMLVHNFRHVLEEGLGLRQIIDYMMVLEHLDPSAREDVVKTVESIGLKGFAASLMWVMGSMLGLERDRMLFDPDERGGEFLLSETMLSGNFGKEDDRNAHQEDESITQHGRRKLRRLLRFLTMYPSEVLSAPFYMLWQYSWRKKNHYLLDGR